MGKQSQFLVYGEDNDGWYFKDANDNSDVQIAYGLSREQAALFAAAPDLLQAAETIINAYHSYEYENRLKIPTEMMDEIKNAVKKAGGETRPLWQRQSDQY